MDAGTRQVKNVDVSHSLTSYRHSPVLDSGQPHRVISSKSLTTGSNRCLCGGTRHRRRGHVAMSTADVVIVATVQATWTTSVPRWRIAEQTGWAESVVECSTIAMWHDAVENGIEGGTHVIQYTCIAHIIISIIIITIIVTQLRLEEKYFCCFL